MHTLQFWNDWPRSYRIFFWICAAFFLATVGLFWYSYFRAPEPALTWEFYQEQELQEIPAHTFQKGLFELTIPGDNYFIFERLLGSRLVPSEAMSYMFVVALVFFTILLLTLVTTFSRFWSLFGLGVFILLIISFRLEIIQAFGLYDKTFTIITLVFYVPLAYYFQAFRTQTPLITRFGFFAGITVLLGLGIYFFAEVQKPFLHLSVTGVVAASALTVFFILTVSHEILASFISILTSGRPSKSLKHFLIISGIYLLNLVLAYAHYQQYIDWNFLYLNFFLLLTVSSLLGVWGIRQREPQLENIMNTNPAAVYLFLGAGAVCFGSLAFFTTNANDPSLSMVKDIIIYSHLGYGLIFLTYVISNFGAMLENNLPVFRVLYKPNRMPYFTFQFGGLITTLAFVLYNTWQTPVYNAVGGYYNAGGDLYRMLNDANYSEVFYEQAGRYGFLNHHSNYAIANLANTRRDALRERDYYNRAARRRPTEMTYLNGAQTFQRERNWLEALFLLNEASEDFPESGPIANTKGLVATKLHLADSALSLFEKARKSSLTKNMAETNLLGLAIRESLPVAADSLFNLLDSDSPGVKGNALAFANSQGRKIDMNVTLPDSAFNLFSATLLNNYMLNHLDDVDTTLVNAVIKLANQPTNANFSEAMLVTASMALYENGEVGRAFSLMQDVTFNSSSKGKYNNMLALWALEQNVPDEALRYLNFSVSQNYENALLTKAIAESESGNRISALMAWDSLSRKSDTTLVRMAESMKRVMGLPSSMTDELSEEELYAYCRYRIPLSDSITLFRLIDSFSDETLKARAILDVSKRLYDQDETSAAINVYQRLDGIQITESKLYEDILHFELIMLAKRGEVTTLANRINEGIEFNKAHENEKIYLTAVINILSNDSINAIKNLEWLASANPYFDDAIILAADYFHQDEDPMRAYDILVNALHRNPRSVKILKEYSKEAARLEFNPFATSALARLADEITPQAFREFMLNNQQVFSNLSP